MPKNKRNGGRMGPLSVGNVVTGGIRLYRDHFKEYYLLALVGYLWAIVPIYGWAKYAAMHGLIARLAFREAIERPETVQQARQQVEPRIWTFLGAGCLIFLIFTGVMFGGGVAVGIIVGLLGRNTGLIFLLGFLGLLALSFLYILLYTKLSIAELPIAIEDLGATESISRSWNLTTESTGHLIAVYLLSFIISLPIVLLVQIVLEIFTRILSTIFPIDLPLFTTLNFVIILGSSFAGGALLIPFWQSIKAIAYYDLCSRQEGMDLNFQDDAGEWQ